MGPELVGCIQTFLRLRQAALPRPNVAPAPDSQDEYGEFDLDFDDPVFNAMLGVEPPVNLLADQEVAFSNVSPFAPELTPF